MKTLREMLMLSLTIALLPAAAQAQEITVTLLGTGTPVPAMNRFGPSIFQRAGVRPERAKSIIAHHVTPEEAGEVFARTKPRLAVYSHIVQPDASEQDLIPGTRKNYAGPVEVGEDLMVIEVGEKIEVRRPARASR
jgi:ribonuclease BN (tRNA processing enzyme)